MSNLEQNPASFRDPKGYVYEYGDKIFRTVTSAGREDYEYVRQCGLFERLIQNGQLTGYEEVVPDLSDPNINQDMVYLLEHPRINFISYPYEWSFYLMQAAALLQIDVYLEALNKGVTLSDATAYNVQFNGIKPIFIDHLSFKPYLEGEYWLAHQQFCEQFLNPLLLYSVCGIPFNEWYRGSLMGIDTNALNKLIPIFRKFSPAIFFHVTLQSFFQRKQVPGKHIKLKKSKLSSSAYKNLFIQLRSLIKKLKPDKSVESVWGEYSISNTYRDVESERKHNFIRDYTSKVMPNYLWDLGTNTGDYAVTALNNGAFHVIGFDSDHNSLNFAYLRALESNLNYLPLYMDMVNPSPTQGWALCERYGFKERKKPDGLIALALLHHLVIGKNIPLKSAIKWIINIAPTGVIEFVPKTDPMVKTMLMFREDIFHDYNLDNFIKLIKENGRVIKQSTITEQGRELIWYEKQNIGK